MAPLDPRAPAAGRRSSALREQGVIPSGARFQVEYPTPMASISGYVVPEQQQALLDSYERAMFADLGRLLAAVPADELAVQWDVAVEFGILEEAFAPGGAQAFDAIIAALARCVDQVPAGIPVGLHMCFAYPSQPAEVQLLWWRALATRDTKTS